MVNIRAFIVESSIFLFFVLFLLIINIFGFSVMSEVYNNFETEIELSRIFVDLVTVIQMFLVYTANIFFIFCFAIKCKYDYDQRLLSQTEE